MLKKSMFHSRSFYHPLRMTHRQEKRRRLTRALSSVRS